MSIKFETINGQLCRMVEPVPLTPESTFPCLVRPIQDDSPMGRMNKRLILDSLVSKRKDGSFITSNIYPDETSEISRIHANWGESLNYEQLEVIGYPVADGSKEWALCMMQKGYTVCPAELPQGIKHLRHVFDIIGWDYEVIDYNTGDKFSQEKWMERTANTGCWQIYEPEPKESPIDPIERPLRSLILEAKEKGVNIRTYYQNLIFTPDALTGLLAKGRFRWLNICNWELTDKEQNYYPPIKLVKPEPEPQPAKEPIVDCNNCKYVCKKSNIDYCYMYEPKPTYKVGDWVEHKESKEQGRITYISSDDYDAIEVKLYDQDELEIYTKRDFNADFRKLDPSEVIVNIGCLSGTVELLTWKRAGFNLITKHGRCWILLDALDAPTRELVESLLKAQEENNG